MFKNSKPISVWSANITKEQTKSWMAFIQSLTKPSSSSPLPDLATSAIISISSLPLITGSTKTEYTTNMRPKSEELNSTLWVPFTMLVCWTLPDFMPLPQSADWQDGLDTIGTLTWKSIFPNYPLLKLFRLSGMELQCLSEDWLQNKLSKNTSTQWRRFWTRAQR